MDIIYLVVAFVIGFVGGALVYRNNLKKAEEFLAKVQKELDDIKNKIAK